MDRNETDFPKDEVRTAISRGIQQAENQKRPKKRKPLFYMAGATVAAIGLLIGSSYVSPAFANSLAQLPIIGSVFGDSNLIGLQQAQKKGLTSKIGETQTVNGISVTLDEILYDQNEIAIGLQIESEQELDERFMSWMDFTINGEIPSAGGGGYKEEILTPTTRTAIQQISVTEEMPDTFELGLVLNGSRGERWYFSTPIKKITDMIKIPIHHSQHVDGIDLTVQELAVSATGVGISYESSEKDTDFVMSRADAFEFRMEDQDGNEIKNHSGGVVGERVKDRMVYKSNKKFDPIESGVTELTITPYLALPTSGGGVEFDEHGEARELEFKGDSLQPVEFKSFKVKIEQ
ncbi:hypothetical protein BEP19_12430 [Ammoniphilus oxalaticus]|uniref:DUF4179 domain-containing protein n=2 Tax=Ammoniphilus oxalaticus TaxID=66863 RepID=A0A419SHG2_9BACL|nr:hypothetical protein BEP19_12430 [Ammoniphilus oxalaticus]